MKNVVEMTVNLLSTIVSIIINVAKKISIFQKIIVTITQKGFGYHDFH